MKIAITGATGFVGKYLSNYLNSNFEIARTSLRDSNWKEHLPADTNVIIHLAGKAHDIRNVSNSHDYFSINRDLTIELFDYFLQSNVKDFFFFSSVKAVTDTVDGILSENFNCNPMTAYGKSKLEAEKELLARPLPEGKRVFIIRPCMIHGPGNKGNLNLLFNVVKKGIPWFLAAFENRRSFLGIDNLCFVIRSLIEKNEASSGIYNLSDDRAISTNELIGLISTVMDKKVRIWKIPKIFIIRLAEIGDKLKLPLNSERLKKLTESYVVSNEKIKAEIGISRLPFSVENGLIKTIRSFNQED